MRKLFLLLALAAAPLGATIEFPEEGSVTPATPITANGSYAGSKISYGGGVILHVVGNPDGATVSLQVNGGAGWIAADTCNAITTAQVCRAAVGPVNLRVVVTSAGGSTSLQIRGFEAEAIVASVSGGGTSSWATITGGSSTETFLVGAGGSFGATSTGTVTATTLAATGGNTSVFVTDAGSGSVTVNMDGTDEWVFSGLLGYFGSAGGASNGPVMLNETPSATNPNFIPNRNETDLNSGLGWAGQGLPSLIADGTEVFRAAATYGSTMGCRFFGTKSAAPTANGACDTYFDTDVARLCFWSGAAWLQVDDSTTGCS